MFEKITTIKLLFLFFDFVMNSKKWNIEIAVSIPTQA